MTRNLSRVLLAFAALVLATGAFMHTSAFNRIVAMLSESNLAAFAASALKVLWLMDSAVALVLAAVFTSVAARPSDASRWIVILLSFIPIATAALLYYFVGNFIGGHMMLAAGLAAFVGGATK
jgi:hypothetical protein